MPKLTKIYTGVGDRGETALAGDARVRKSSARIDAIGEVDEANAAIGLARAAYADQVTETMLARIQHELFDLGAELARAPGGAARILPEQAARLEREIDLVSAALALAANFVLPGGSEAAARLHHARAVARRAERALWRLAESEPVAEAATTYLNRLSDLLFVLARRANGNGRHDVLWREGEAR